MIFCQPALAAMVPAPEQLGRVQEPTIRSSVVVASERRRSFMNASHDDEHRIVVPTQQARQGVTGHHVRYVLGVGLIGVIAAFAVVYAIYFI
jgi:hypothetical protein